MAPIKLAVTLVIEVDPQEWVIDHDVDPNDPEAIAADVRDYVKHNVLPQTFAGGAGTLRMED